MSEKPPLQEALRSEILKLATDGDSKKDGELTPDVLQRIMRVAKTGRDLLVSLDASPSNLAGMVKSRSPMGIPVYGSAAEVGDDEEYLSIPPLATTPPAENFGMAALRQVISAVKNLNGNGNSPVKLVEALVIAREKGLADVALKLEAELGMGKEKGVPSPVVPLESVDTEKGEPQS